MSIYQCCKNPINPQGKTAYHQQETMLSEMNRNDYDPRQNFYKDMCKFLRWFQKKTDKSVLPMLIGDWNEECIGNSNSKKLYDEFEMVNIFHRKYPNHKKFKTYQDGSMFIDYGIIQWKLIEQVDQKTYEPFEYRKGKEVLKYKVAQFIIRSMSYYDNRQRSFNWYNDNSNCYFWLG